MRPYNAIINNPISSSVCVSFTYESSLKVNEKTNTI